MSAASRAGGSRRTQMREPLLSANGSGYETRPASPGRATLGDPYATRPTSPTRAPQEKLANPVGISRAASPGLGVEMMPITESVVESRQVHWGELRTTWRRQQPKTKQIQCTLALQLLTRERGTPAVRTCHFTIAVSENDDGNCVANAVRREWTKLGKSDDAIRKADLPSGEIKYSRGVHDHKPVLGLSSEELFSTGSLNITAALRPPSVLVSSTSVAHDEDTELFDRAPSEDSYKLTVHVSRGKELKGVSTDGTSNPVVRCELRAPTVETELFAERERGKIVDFLPETFKRPWQDKRESGTRAKACRRRYRKRTAVVKRNNINPVWNEDLSFDIPKSALIRGKDGRERERLEACVLHIECFSKGSWGSLTPIGSTSVRSTAYAFVYSCELLISEVSSALAATAPTLDGYYGLLAIALLVNADPPG